MLVLCENVRRAAVLADKHDGNRRWAASTLSHTLCVCAGFSKSYDNGRWLLVLVFHKDAIGLFVYCAFCLTIKHLNTGSSLRNYNCHLSLIYSTKIYFLWNLFC